VPNADDAATNRPIHRIVLNTVSHLSSLWI